MQTRVLHRVFSVCLLLALLGGCASYQGAQARPAKYEKDGKPASGDFRVNSVFTF